MVHPTSLIPCAIQTSTTSTTVATIGKDDSSGAKAVYNSSCQQCLAERAALGDPEPGSETSIVHAIDHPQQ